MDKSFEELKEFASALADELGEGMHELPDGSALQVGAPIEKPLEISPETQEKLDKIPTKIDEKFSPVETVRLKLSRGKTTVFDSKMGGYPHFEQEDPRDRSPAGGYNNELQNHTVLLFQ